MKNLKEVAEKSEGRVVLVTMPKNEPTTKGAAEITAKAPEKPKEKPQAKPQKNLAEMQADFERLRNLFFRKSRFESAIEKLKDFDKNLKQTGEEIESEGFKLILSSGYSREDVKINNVVVISDCVKFMLARIESTIESIETDILNE
jgi:hypothetical protein